MTNKIVCFAIEKFDPSRQESFTLSFAASLTLTTRQRLRQKEPFSLVYQRDEKAVTFARVKRPQVDNVYVFHGESTVARLRPGQ